MTNHLFTEIEGDAFAGAVSMAGGLAQFTRVLRGQKAVRELVDAASKDSAIVSRVLDRLAELTRLRIDVRYENPNDTAIAAYLLVLSASSPSFYQIAVDLVHAAQNLWWSTQLVRVGLDATNTASQGTTIVVGQAQLTFQTNTLESCLWAFTSPDSYISGLQEGLPDSADSGRAYEPDTESTDMLRPAADSQYAWAA